MQLFCPACQTAFPGVSRCPRCGGLLLMPHEVSPDATHHRPDAPPEPLRATPTGRVAVGTVLALGMYLGIRKVVTGTVLALEPDPATWWLSFSGLAAVHAAQVAAVLFGAVIAAAGRTRGYPLGFTVGAVCGGLFTGYEFLTGAPADSLVFYMQVPVLALIGLVAGATAARIWGTVPEIEVPIVGPGKLSSIHLSADVKADPGRPTIWLRVLAGAAIMVIGAVIADPARHAAQKYSGGTLRVQSQGQGKFITWQFATFAVLLGGVVASAGTGAGIRHGLLAGGIGGAAVFGVCFKMGQAVPAVDYWLSSLSLDALPLTAPPVVVGIAGGVLLVGLFGGCLGSLLFPPLAPESMRNRPRLGQD